MNRLALRPITEDEIRTFWEDGVVYLGPMFDSEWVERVGAAIDEAPGAYGERNFIWPVSEAVREMLFDSPLGEIAATLLRSETIGHMGDIEWVKDPYSESLTPWHQDQPYLQLGGRQTCNLWVGIDPATGENGAVEWVKGSHNWGKVFEPEPFDGSAPKEVRSGRERVPDFDKLHDQYDIVRFDTEPGDCIVAHGMMVHGAGDNRTDKQRRAISHNLFGDDAYHAAIPPGRGMEDTKDYGLVDGEPFPADHELLPRIWPKRPRGEWPRPTGWSHLPQGVVTYRDAGIPGEGPSATAGN